MLSELQIKWQAVEIFPTANHHLAFKQSQPSPFAQLKLRWMSSAGRKPRPFKLQEPIQRKHRFHLMLFQERLP